MKLGMIFVFLLIFSSIKASDALGSLPDSRLWETILGRFQSKPPVIDQVNGYIDPFEYIQKSLKDKNADIPLILQSLHSTLGVCKVITQRLHVGKQEHANQELLDAAIFKAFQPLRSEQIRSSIENVIPIEVLKKFLNQNYQNFVKISRSPSELRLNMESFLKWINLWETRFATANHLMIKEEFSLKIDYKKMRKDCLNFVLKIWHLIRNEGNDIEASKELRKFISYLNGVKSLKIFWILFLLFIIIIAW